MHGIVHGIMKKPPGGGNRPGAKRKPFGPRLRGKLEGFPMKMPRPWYRKQTDTWYICLHGRQVPLCKGKDNKAEAERVYFQVMAREGGKLPEAVTLTTAQVCDLFLDWSQKHNDP